MRLPPAAARSRTRLPDAGDEALRVRRVDAVAERRALALLALQERDHRDDHLAVARVREHRAARVAEARGARVAVAVPPVVRVVLPALPGEHHVPVARDLGLLVEQLDRREVPLEHRHEHRLHVLGAVADDRQVRVAVARLLAQRVDRADRSELAVARRQGRGRRDRDHAHVARLRHRELAVPPRVRHRRSRRVLARARIAGVRARRRCTSRRGRRGRGRSGRRRTRCARATAPASPSRRPAPCSGPP